VVEHFLDDKYAFQLFANTIISATRLVMEENLNHLIIFYGVAGSSIVVLLGIFQLCWINR
jgi:hypothetical protein